jgi:hypothetical protein
MAAPPPNAGSTPIGASSSSAEDVSCIELRQPHQSTGTLDDGGPAKLAGSLGKQIEELKIFFQQDPEEAVGKLPTIVGGGGSMSLQAQFRRGLAEWSIAEFFNNWSPGRLDEIIASKSLRPSRKPRTGSIRSFARAHFHPSCELHVLKATANGFAYLAVESRFPQCGIFLAFAHRLAHSMEFESVMAALGTPLLFPLKELAETSWMEKARACYDTQCPRGAPSKFAEIFLDLG